MKPNYQPRFRYILTLLFGDQFKMPSSGVGSDESTSHSSESGSSYNPELESDQSGESSSQTDSEESEYDGDQSGEAIMVEDYVRVSLS